MRADYCRRVPPQAIAYLDKHGMAAAQVVAFLNGAIQEAQQAQVYPKLYDFV